MRKEVKNGVQGVLDPNYDDLNRFLASIGMRAIIASYAIIFLSIYLDSKLGISESLPKFFVMWIIPLIMIIGGLVAIYLGIERWKDRQEKLDEKLDLEVEMKRRELESEKLSGENIDEGKKSVVSKEGEKLDG